MNTTLIVCILYTRQYFFICTTYGISEWNLVHIIDKCYILSSTFTTPEIAVICPWYIRKTNFVYCFVINYLTVNIIFIQYTRDLQFLAKGRTLAVYFLVSTLGFWHTFSTSCWDMFMKLQREMNDCAFQFFQW